MILPLGDMPNPRGVPFVTYALIAVNCAVYALFALPLTAAAPDPGDPRLREYLEVLVGTLPPGVSPTDVLRQISAYDLFVFSYGYRPSDPSVLTLLSAMFLHGGFLHLAGNMLFLWIYGDNVEHRLGGAAFLFWYLITGIAATWFHAAFNPSSPIPLVGASGAISGVLGFYFLWFPRNKVRMWVLLFPFFMNEVVVPARLVLGFYLFIDNVLPFILAGGGASGVAHGAHIGGFIAGLAVAWVVDRRTLSSRPSEYRGDQSASRTAPAGDAVRAAIREGRFDEAATLFFSVPPDRTRGLLSVQESLALGGWLAHNGHAKAALNVYQRQLRDHPVGPGAAEAHVGAGLVQLRSFGQAAAAYQHLVEALDLDPSPDTERVAREALSVIASRQKFSRSARQAQ